MTEWTGIRQISTIREWSSNPEADEAFAQAFEQRKRERESSAAESAADAPGLGDPLPGRPGATSSRSAS